MKKDTPSLMGMVEFVTRHLKFYQIECLFSMFSFRVLNCLQSQ